MAIIAALLVVSTCCLALLLRFAFLLAEQRQGRLHPRRHAPSCHVAVFLGSGGHTTEMLQLLRALPRERYTRRTYIVSRGDQFSIKKAQEAEPEAIEVVELPRARRVHQTWLSTPVSTFLALLSSLRWVAFARDTKQEKSEASPRRGATPNVILMNGPGTCVSIVAAVWIMRLLGRPSPRLIYIESFARVKSLSLTAKLVRHFVDCFVVQWPEALVKGAQYRGWLV